MERYAFLYDVHALCTRRTMPPRYAEETVAPRIRHDLVISLYRQNHALFLSTK